MKDYETRPKLYGGSTLTLISDGERLILIPFYARQRRVFVHPNDLEVRQLEGNDVL